MKRSQGSSWGRFLRARRLWPERPRSYGVHPTICLVRIGEPQTAVPSRAPRAARQGLFLFRQDVSLFLLLFGQECYADLPSGRIRTLAPVVRSLSASRRLSQMFECSFAPRSISAEWPTAVKSPLIESRRRSLRERRRPHRRYANGRAFS